VSKIGDPGFRYHVALVQVWGVMALRLANADVIPLDYAPYAQAIRGFVREVEGRTAGAAAFTDLHGAAQEFEKAADAFNLARSRALTSADTAELADLNARLLRVERALLDPVGIPGRPWYRHLVYAPKFTYAPEILPGVAEAVDARDERRTAREAGRLAAALRRAAATLQPR
jgi:N-acetylated-alpha-linked acidic dipeptidase